MRKYVKPEIYFGCKRDKTKTDRQQPKDITKEWFVYYHYDYPVGHAKYGKNHRFKLKDGINKHHRIQERLEEALAVKEAINDLLINGYDPFSDNITMKTDGDYMSFANALLYAFDKVKVNYGPKSQIDLSSGIRLVIKYAEQMGYSDIPVKEIRRIQIKEVIEFMQQERGFGNVRYNELYGFVKTMFGQLVEDDILQTSCLFQSKNKPIEDSEVHDDLTKEEKSLIFKHIAPNYPEFFTYIMTIYHSGMRPVEILRLKINDYDPETPIIRIPRKISKTGKKVKYRYAAVPNELKILLDTHIAKSNPAAFIFHKDFLPSVADKPIHRNRASEFWKEKVRDGLGINKTMYGLKYTSGDDMIERGIRDDYVQHKFGHASKKMTEKYQKNKSMIMAKKIGEQSTKFIDE